MAADDGARRRQAQAHALLLGGIEGLEHLLARHGRQATPAVFHTEANGAGGVLPHLDDYPPLLGRYPFEGVQGIEQQIEDDLLQLAFVGQQRRQALLQAHLHGDLALVQFGADEIQYLLHGIGDVEPVLGHLRLAHQAAHPGDHRAGAVGVVDDALRRLHGALHLRRLIAQPALAGVATGGNGGEWLVHLVGDGRGQFPQLAQAPGLDQARPGRIGGALGGLQPQRQGGDRDDGQQADDAVDQPRLLVAAAGGDIAAKHQQRATQGGDRDPARRQEAGRQEHHNHLEDADGDLPVGKGVQQGDAQRQGAEAS